MNKIKAIKYLVLVIISSFLVIYFKISPNRITNYTEIMSGVLSFASMGTGFMITAFSLLPIFSESKLVTKMRELGTDLKIMNSLLNASILLFFSSLLSLFGLFIPHNSSNLISVIFIALWSSFMLVTLIKAIQVIFFLILTFKNLYNENYD